MELFFPGFIYGILQILTGNRTVRGNLDNIHTVNITEFLLFGKCRTGHAGLLIKLVKEVLEGDGCKGLTLSFHLHVFLGFNGLMKSVGITTARHNTSGKFIDD